MFLFVTVALQPPIIRWVGRSLVKNSTQNEKCDWLKMRQALFSRSLSKVSVELVGKKALESDNQARPMRLLTHNMLVCNVKVRHDQQCYLLGTHARLYQLSDDVSLSVVVFILMDSWQACADTAGREAGLRPLNFPLRVRGLALLLLGV